MLNYVHKMPKITKSWRKRINAIGGSILEQPVYAIFVNMAKAPKIAPDNIVPIEMARLHFVKGMWNHMPNVKKNQALPG
jgi:hypothetical protein